MSILELEDAWEEPMPDLVRALLLTEIRRRNYRVKSLPKPPPSSTHTSLQPLSVRDQELPHAEQGVGIILVIAVFQLLSGALLAWDVMEAPPEMLPVSHTLGAGYSSGLGIVFLLLCFWARFDAYYALLAALTLFIAIYGLETVQLGITPSVGVQLIVTLYLAIGIRSAARLESTERP